MRYDEMAALQAARSGVLRQASCWSTAERTEIKMISPPRFRVYRPARTAMQSGSGNTRQWLLEPEPAAPRPIDPLMGYTSSQDTTAQLRLNFDTKEAALLYARRHGLTVRVIEPKPRRQIAKSYADNFRFGRQQPWTH